LTSQKNIYNSFINPETQKEIVMGRPKIVTVEEFVAKVAVEHFIKKNKETTLDALVEKLSSRVKEVTPENKGVYVSKITEALEQLETDNKITVSEDVIKLVPGIIGRPRGSKNAPKATPDVVSEVVPDTSIQTESAQS
jgi:hypothetical protein